MADRHLLAGALALGSLLFTAAPALAHVERTSYWPDPGPDTSVSPPAGGSVPEKRTLASALRSRPPGDTRVVCQPESLQLAFASIRNARREGVVLRPTQVTKPISRTRARRLRRLNRKFFARCEYREIQPAVDASGNNDRVVIMPGVYSEPTSRQVPKYPEECEKYRTKSENGTGAASYEFQYYCPNAQALVAVIGRGLGPGQDPPTTTFSRPDPHNIPNEGPCIRCNLQIEGSGASPDDVVIDAGRVESGNGGPAEPVKDVTLKADRADGIVVRNMTLRHAAEHALYTLEVDGYRLERMKFFYAGEYGTLTFASDHGLTDTCDSAGHGDAAVYPGGAPDTGAERNQSFYGEFRYNQEIRNCDLHHSNLGYSGTMGNAVHVHNNNFFDNATGIATDSFYAGGHPGYPQDSSLFDFNRIYSNNFWVYGPDSDVESRTPVPAGSGIVIGGGNYNLIRNNYIWDNWTKGTMLITVPDVISCAPSSVNEPKCIPSDVRSTSNYNRQFNNVMGRTPTGKRAPNGVDFWWDEGASTVGNCWYSNIGPDGSEGSLKSDPPMPPVTGTSVPKFLPMDCERSVGAGDAVKEQMLVRCLVGIAGDVEDGNLCDWFAEPVKPGSQAAAERARNQALLAEQYSANPLSPARNCTLIGGTGGSLSCDPFRGRIGG